MRTKIGMLFIMAMFFGLSAIAQDNVKVAVFNAEMHCNGCKNKVEKKISFEKGVKDVDINMEAQTVTVKYNTEKTTSANLLTAFEEIEVPAIVKKACCSSATTTACGGCKSHKSTDADAKAHNCKIEGADCNHEHKAEGCEHDVDKE